MSTTGRHLVHFGREFVVGDTGTHSVSVNSVLNSFGEQSEFVRGSVCSAEISVERKNIGRLDPNFGKGGLITAIQTKTMPVRVRP